ncbi:tyrosine-protein phosphatase non-receptor type substrate 1-like [Alligator sinensis]|uniref:Tyrosine-protein phosphatase non-receptor type substrate 1-like n=1 Tax=Alligator sinensis TaxID=38654 RepID=A0A1U8D9W9_ALLSI|nr:tyrosine-protein phosphatase non-receptor type substrate 1-like [Alligator sinensis]
MEPLAAASRCPVWCLTSLFLFSFNSWAGAGGQDFQVLQPKEPVSVSAGDTLELNCTVPQRGPAGPVKWFKGSGGDRQLVFTDTGSFPRFTKAVPNSLTDFSIHISDVRPEDAGTYYCVKFTKGVSDEEYRSGAGMMVSVSASPSAPSVSGPTSRVELGSPVNFTCTSEGFSPRNIAVTWLKDGAKLPAQPLQILPENASVSYRVSSTLVRTLTVGDIRSQLTCQIEHSTMSAPLQETYNLSQALRVSPRPRLTTNYSGAVPVNEMVAFTCSLVGFYPNVARLTWMENGNETGPEKSPSPTENPNGTFSLTRTLEVRATEQRNQSSFTCRAVHDSQPPASVTRVLAVTATSNKMEEDKKEGENGVQIIYIAVGVVCLVLGLLMVAVIYLIWAKQSKGKSSPSVRLHESEKSSRTAPQDSDTNNLTYADLNFDKAKKDQRRIIEMSQQSEYACIQTSPPAANEDNLTYADLDMVHLSQAPKRPAPLPEETGSEYASVQIQKK